MNAVNLQALIADVARRAAGSPLDRIEAALAVSEELQSGADDLVGHFVTEARQAGCSWTEIGERLGVSKQAARQRFTGPSAWSGELAEQPRLLACLQAARREASAEGAAEIGTHHQLAGLFEEGAAAAIMEQIGLRRDAVRRAGHELFPASGEPAAPGAEPPPESAEAREALAGATSLARRAGHRYVGTEHLLGALALDPGSRARRVLIRLDASIPAIKRELECYISPSRRRRRRGKSGDRACSFCGKADDSGVAMVAGPGVWICAECVTLAGEILAGPRQPEVTAS
ncbi:MAG TPA: Clp protease N-terminal domain-containing protein [Streptosporangiaceae bacterium]